LFPEWYREELEAIEARGEDVDSRRMRTVVDFIASLTEQQAANLYHRITGHSARPVFERFM
jgi:dGTP triphosphohydrolase